MRRKVRKSKQPLFEKSGAKTFVYAGPVAVKPARAQSKQSFFASFCSQQEALTCLPNAPG
jgi:hypothetical protein